MIIILKDGDFIPVKYRKLPGVQKLNLNLHLTCLMGNIVVSDELATV